MIDDLALHVDWRSDSVYANFTFELWSTSSQSWGLLLFWLYIKLDARDMIKLCQSSPESQMNSEG